MALIALFTLALAAFGFVQANGRHEDSMPTTTMVSTLTMYGADYAAATPTSPFAHLITTPAVTEPARLEARQDWRKARDKAISRGKAAGQRGRQKGSEGRRKGQAAGERGRAQAAQDARGAQRAAASTTAVIKSTSAHPGITPPPQLTKRDTEDDLTSAKSAASSAQSAASSARAVASSYRAQASGLVSSALAAAQNLSDQWASWDKDHWANKGWDDNNDGQKDKATTTTMTFTVTSTNAPTGTATASATASTTAKASSAEGTQGTPGFLEMAATIWTTLLLAIGIAAL